MKILYIVNARIPTEKAHGIQIMKMCETFSNNEIKLELILPTRRNKIFKNTNIFKHYSIKENFKFKKILSYDPYYLIKLPQGTYIKFQALFFIFSLFFYLFFKKNKKDYIFYTRDEYLLPILQLFSKKVVWEGHSLSKNKNIYIKYFNKCYRIIVLTSYIKKELIDLVIEENKILVSPDGVDLNIFDIDITKKQARKKLNLPQDKIILGYTGTLKTKNMDKGIDNILEVLKILLKQKNNILFVAVGGCRNDVDYYIKRANKIGVLNNVLFLEKVFQEKLAIYQKAFDFLLMPFPNKKHYSHYMSPLKMFEYMVSKRPIIASNLPSIKEILNNNNSVLVEPDNSVLLSEGIKKLLKDEKLITNISQKAYNNVKKYTWDKRVKKIVKFVKNDK